MIYHFTKFALGLSFKPTLKGQSRCTPKDVIWCMSQLAVRALNKERRQNPSIQKSITMNTVEPSRDRPPLILSAMLFEKEPRLSVTTAGFPKSSIAAGGGNPMLLHDFQSLASSQSDLKSMAYTPKFMFNPLLSSETHSRMLSPQTSQIMIQNQIN